MGQECTISAYQHVAIGRECIVADRVMLIDFDHGVVEVDRPIRLQGIYKRDVRVGHNVWIGYGACILRGVSRRGQLDRRHERRGDRRRAGERGRRGCARAGDPHARGSQIDALGVAAPVPAARGRRSPARRYFFASATTSVRASVFPCFTEIVSLPERLLCLAASSALAPGPVRRSATVP